MSDETLGRIRFVGIVHELADDYGIMSVLVVIAGMCAAKARMSKDEGERLEYTKVRNALVGLTGVEVEGEAKL